MDAALDRSLIILIVVFYDFFRGLVPDISGCGITAFVGILGRLT